MVTVCTWLRGGVRPCGALLAGLPAGPALLHLLGVAVAADPVVELLPVGLLAAPQHRQRAARLLHHVHDAVQQLWSQRGQRGAGIRLVYIKGSRHGAEEVRSD